MQTFMSIDFMLKKLIGILYLHLYINKYSLMFDSNPDQTKPIAYVITQDFNADHVEQLVEAFDKNYVPYILQKETDTLGQPLDKRYFVVVDNIKGVVILGPEFSSLLMFIVGYPKRGSNKKNHYCKKAQDVIIKYKQFCTLPELERTNFKTSMIKSKSQLKTIKSIPRSRQSSSILHQRSQSVSQKSVQPSIKPRSLAEINEKSKIFMLKVLTQRNQQSFLQYNKQIARVAATNPNRCKTVDNFDEMRTLLGSSPHKYNQLIINEINEKDLQSLDKKNYQNLNIMIYKPANAIHIKRSNKDNNPKKNNPSNALHIKYCNSLEDIFSYVHALTNESKPESSTFMKISKLEQCHKSEKKVEKLKNKKIIWARTESEEQNEKKEGVKKQQIKHISSENQIVQVKALQKNKKISFTEHNICETKKDGSRQDIETIQSQPNKNQNVIEESDKNSLKISSNQKMLNNQVPIAILPAPSINQKVDRQPPKIQATKTMVKRIKRVKSLYNKTLKNSLQNEQISQNSTKQFRGLNKEIKFIKRRIIMPQQYCPFSPVSQEIRQESKTTHRKLRCKSEQPEIRQVKMEQVNVMTEIKNQNRNLKTIIKVCPIFEHNTRFNEANNFYDKFYSSQYGTPHKKQNIFRSTTNSDNDYYLFVESKNTDFGSTLDNYKEPIRLHQLPSPYKFGTFGNLITVGVGEDKEYITSIVEQNGQNMSKNKMMSNKIYNSLAVVADKQSRMSLNSQIISFNSLQNKVGANFVNNGRKEKKLAKPVCLLWKQFNYEIKEQIEEMQDEINDYNMRSYSFYHVQQLDKIIKCLPQLCKIVLFLDDVEKDKYLTYVSQMSRNFDSKEGNDNKYELIGVYLYPKSGSSIFNMKSLAQKYEVPEELRKRIKVIMSNDYYNNKKEIGNEILQKLLQNNGEESISWTTNSQV